MFTGELGPTTKLKRNTVFAKYKAQIDTMFAQTEKL
jgi:hypothetical protein